LSRTVANKLTTFTVAENVGFEGSEFTDELLLPGLSSAKPTVSKAAETSHTKPAESHFLQVGAPEE